MKMGGINIDKALIEKNGKAGGVQRGCGGRTIEE